jgi:hypothetical protein
MKKSAILISLLSILFYGKMLNAQAEQKETGKVEVLEGIDIDLEENTVKAEAFDEIYAHPLKGHEAFKIRKDIFDLSLNTLLQVQAAPYAGEDSLLENSDPATNEGFRVRRAKIGIYAGISDKLRMNLGYYLYDKNSGGAELIDANIIYRASPFLNFAVGTAPLPFSIGSIVSSSKLQMIERSFAAQKMTPQHQLGFSVFGQFKDGLVEYAGGIFNGYEGYSKGDMGKGFLYAGRIQVNPFGSMDFQESDYEYSSLKIGLGADYYYNDDSSIITHAVSGDLQMKWHGLSLKCEGIYDRKKPADRPTLPSKFPDLTERVGGYVQAGYFVIRSLIELAARYEYYDNNRKIDDTGDLAIITGGMNIFLMEGYLKMQINYIHRDETNVPELKNDLVLMQWQVSL